MSKLWHTTEGLFYWGTAPSSDYNNEQFSHLHTAIPQTNGCKTAITTAIKLATLQQNGRRNVHFVAALQVLLQL